MFLLRFSLVQRLEVILHSLKKIPHVIGTESSSIGGDEVWL
uniref:Uncharacterized protein n=1 Tax=Arundo donax TaxID=35708 RepID=A0A0A8Y0Y3_ARUDO